MNSNLHRDSVGSGVDWEEIAGYARAVRIGDRILVSGTTATGSDGNVVGAGDPADQARFIFDKIETAIQQLGGKMRDVISTRTYVRHAADTEAIARVHGERFAKVRPVSTLVEAGLIGDEYLVEIEVEAVIGAGDAL